MWESRVLEGLVVEGGRKGEKGRRRGRSSG